MCAHDGSSPCVTSTTDETTDCGQQTVPLLETKDTDCKVTMEEVKIPDRSLSSDQDAVIDCVITMETKVRKDSTEQDGLLLHRNNP